MPVSWWAAVPGLLMEQLQTVQLAHVLMQEQYTFLYEALLEALLCGSTGVPVESIVKKLRPQGITKSLRRSSRYHQDLVHWVWCCGGWSVVPPHYCSPTQWDRDGDNISGVAEEGEELTGRTCLAESSLQTLQKFSELFQLLPCREAEKPSNQPKNRKPGILPADSCRPILMSSLNADGSPGYINAIFANTYTEEDRLIVTQLPFSSTLVDFWALVWDYTCTSVVVLNQLQELDKTYVEFWPSQGEATYGHFHVHLISEEPGDDFTTCTLALTNSQQPKKSALQVLFWQLKDWPMQQRLPPHPATIISLLGKVETHHRQSRDGHILVTCWDGASRSGIFCAASFLCEQIQSEGLVDVSQAVRMLKRRRRQLIKDVEQYGLCYELALIYLNLFETYGNFK
nr:PREDICTED: receptor-type tyrosine-protein phosphatase U-like [Phalacrocorax carbo]